MEEQSKQNDAALDINVMAHEDGQITVRFNRPVQQLGFNAADAANFLCAISTALTAVLNQKPMIELAKGN